MSVTDYDEIWDDPDGSLTGYLLYGDDISVEDVEVFLATEHAETHGYIYDGDQSGSEGGWEITECWVRKVPGRDGYGGTWLTYHYQDHPGRGARRCLRVEEHHFWGHWCHNHIYEPATSGIPVEQFTPDSLIWPFVHARINPPERRRPHDRDGEPMVYLCGPCARSHRARMERAKNERMRDFHRERGENKQAEWYEARLRGDEATAAAIGAAA
jgi:hypothetical protein